MAAVFMGGIMIHELSPGFELFTRHVDILTTLYFGLIVANFLLLGYYYLGLGDPIGKEAISKKVSEACKDW